MLRVGAALRRDAIRLDSTRIPTFRYIDFILLDVELISVIKCSTRDYALRLGMRRDVQ